MLRRNHHYKKSRNLLRLKSDSRKLLLFPARLKKRCQLWLVSFDASVEFFNRSVLGLGNFNVVAVSFFIYRKLVANCNDLCLSATFPSLSFRAYLYILAFTLRDQENRRARISYIPRTRYCFSINGRGKEERLSLALEQARRPIPFAYFWCTIYPL